MLFEKLLQLLLDELFRLEMVGNVVIVVVVADGVVVVVVVAE